MATAMATATTIPDMRPILLKPDDKILCRGRVMTFLRRESRSRGFSRTLNWFLCPDYAGQIAPNDPGHCTMTDHYVSKHVTRFQEAA